MSSESTESVNSKNLSLLVKEGMYFSPEKYLRLRSSAERRSKYCLASDRLLRS